MLNTNYLPGTAFALDDAILVEIRTDMNLVFGALSLPRRGRPSGERRGHRFEANIHTNQLCKL